MYWEVNIDLKTGFSGLRYSPRSELKSQIATTVLVELLSIAQSRIGVLFRGMHAATHEFCMEIGVGVSLKVNRGGWEG